MSQLPTFLQVIVLLAVIITIFNIIIFVHELGHFLAARWRGLQVDRFQIWFGKPIWKKDVNGVQYGLGWLPFGGFVALPQMAPMEAIEGGEKHEKPLPPISALDKIIVAFAGPLFSMLLALASALVVWQVGKPKDFMPATEIGYVAEKSPAEKAGLKPGDVILKINGEAVNGFAGSLDSIQERIILSRGEKIVFTVERPGVDEPIELTSGFETEDSKWYQRRALREVGIAPAGPAFIGEVMPKSPASKAGLKPGDQIVSVDGKELRSRHEFSRYLESNDWKAVTIGVRSPDGEVREVQLAPESPLQPKGRDPMIGVGWDMEKDVDVRIVKPAPLTQVVDSLEMMWVTITSVAAPNSSIGVDHLSGPVGIAKVQFQMLKTDNGWRRILAFMVLFNVNLAVLNMLPFPVLDGGHITLAILEKIAGRPVQAKPLEIVQTVCALALISLMIFVTSKDIGDGFGRGSGDGQEVVFPD